MTPDAALMMSYPLLIVAAILGAAWIIFRE